MLLDGHSYPAGKFAGGQLGRVDLLDGQLAGVHRFAQRQLQAVERGVKIVVVDSLNGYLNAVPDERFMTTYLHEMLTYLGQHRVATILVGVQQGMLGGTMSTAKDASYVADNVMMLRNFELDGEIHKAISVFKKRGSAHERTIRSLRLTGDGIEVGKVLRGFHGLLTGVPTKTAAASDD